MTGLSLENDALVEIAVLVTDANLNVLGDGVDVVISTTLEKLTAMRDEVRVMHTNRASWKRFLKEFPFLPQKN